MQDLAHVDAPAGRVLEEILTRDFLQRQKAVAFGAVVDEAGFERGLDAGDTPLVDIRLFLFARRQLDRQVVKLLTPDGGRQCSGGRPLGHRNAPGKKPRACGQNQCIVVVHEQSDEEIKHVTSVFLVSGNRRRVERRCDCRPDSMASLPRTN
ncbi:MAG: hypothetical protein EBT81_00580 [Gammaproteobacteria bacterium]|nr:hypothetical protein [Gammaproteobacteria bacterium]